MELLDRKLAELERDPALVAKATELAAADERKVEEAKQQVRAHNASVFELREKHRQVRQDLGLDRGHRHELGLGR